MGSAVGWRFLRVVDEISGLWIGFQIVRGVNSTFINTFDKTKFSSKLKLADDNFRLICCERSPQMKRSRKLSRGYSLVNSHVPSRRFS